MSWTFGGNVMDYAMLYFKSNAICDARVRLWIHFRKKIVFWIFLSLPIKFNVLISMCFTVFSCRISFQVPIRISLTVLNWPISFASIITISIYSIITITSTQFYSMSFKKINKNRNLKKLNKKNKYKHLTH